MFDTGATVHICPLWFCNDYPVYKPYYVISLIRCIRRNKPVYGIISVRMQLTDDPLIEVCVQFVAAYVTEPIISSMTLRANGVKVDLSHPGHAILPCGAKVHLEQHFTYFYIKIYRMIPVQEVECSKNNMLTFSVRVETPLPVCPTYIRSTLRRATGGTTYYWELYHHTITLRRVHRCQRMALSVPTTNTIPEEY